MRGVEDGMEWEGIGSVFVGGMCVCMCVCVSVCVCVCVCVCVSVCVLTQARIYAYIRVQNNSLFILIIKKVKPIKLI